MDRPHCPHHATCNFQRTLAEADRPELRALASRYCASPVGCTRCFRAQFARSLGPNLDGDLGGDITPDARRVTGLERVLPPSDLAADQAARLFATRAA